MTAGSFELPGTTVAPVLHLRYRSATAFLIAYSVRLAKGDLFVESDNPWPPGTRATLRLLPPEAAPLELEAAVAWTRAEARGPGEPAGMGLTLLTPIDAYGAVVDELASRYARVRILLGAGEPAPRAIISRYLRSILACELCEPGPATGGANGGGANGGVLVSPEAGAGSNGASGTPAAGSIDLAVIDLDSSGAAGTDLIQRLRLAPESAEIPILVLATHERDRLRGVSLGADEALANPPPYDELQAAVVHVLSRPQVVAPTI